ncbi:ABC transporter permease [Schinkia sp. CFF1]
MNNPFSLLYKYRKILFNLAANDIKQKYAGSLLGGMWIVLYPLLFLSVYFLVYIAIFKIRLEGLSTVDYVLIIFSGLIPWFGFADAIGISVNSVTANSSLIKNTLFPIELIPVKVVLSSMVSQIIGLVLLLVVLAFRGQLSFYVLWLPLILFLQILFTMGLAWILASINVFFRDVGQVINVILILLMLVSPIAYTVDMLDENLLFFMKFNPLYYMILVYREVIMYQSFPSMDVTLIFVLMSFIVFYIGYYIFTRLKVVFSDYV